MEETMHTHTLGLAASLALLAAVPFAAEPAQAAAAPGALTSAIDTLDLVTQAQYVYGGRRHCWYPNGWNGPGWYWCGYHVRRGYGWGGGAGYRGWDYRGPRRYEYRRY
jgi:hypothetical protein